MHDCAIDHALADKGLRKTTDRHRILELFTANRTWTAAAAQKKLGNVDLSTVYRNLRTLVREGLLSVADIPGTEEHFEHPPAAHHDHLACRRCAAVECLPCPVPSLAAHTLQINGLCAACK